MEDLENKLKRLEEIVKSLESEEVSLERSLQLFEEGVKLAGAVKKELDQSKLRVKQITKNGEFPFDWEGL